MDKVDLERTIATYRAPRGRFEVVDVATATYLAVDGHGDPNTSAATTSCHRSRVCGGPTPERQRTILRQPVRPA